jgi:multidrug efflux pump
MGLLLQQKLATPEFNVTTATDLRKVEEFQDIVVRTINGMPVRLGDVARVQQGPLAERFSVRYNSNEAIALGVLRTATANPLELSKAITAMLPRIQENLPPGVKIEVANDG